MMLPRSTENSTMTILFAVSLALSVHDQFQAEKFLATLMTGDNKASLQAFKDLASLGPRAWGVTRALLPLTQDRDKEMRYLSMRLLAEIAPENKVAVAALVEQLENDRILYLRVRAASEL